MDVDGVLTDGKLHFTSDGQEFKTFDVQDGHGISMAHRAGLLIGFISGRPSKATERRATDLGVNILRQGAVNKMEMVETVKAEHKLRDEEIAFIGDELVDLPVLRRAGLAIAVPNAMDEVKDAAHYITKHRGGDGAVREVIEMILKAQGSWTGVVAKYLALLLAAIIVAMPVKANDATNKPATTPQLPSMPAAPAASGYIEKFEVPDRDDEGNLRWKMYGDKALINEQGVMNATNFRAELYQSNKVDTVFTTPNCIIDRVNKRATTDAPVRIEREGFVVTGTGADWNNDTAMFVIRSNVQVEVRSAGQSHAVPEKAK